MTKINNFLGGLLFLASLIVVCQGLNEVQMAKGDQKPFTGYIADYGNAPWMSTISEKIQIIESEVGGAPCHKFNEKFDKTKGRIAVIRGDGIQTRKGEYGDKERKTRYRYNCLLSTMASHAQLAGAKAVIIEVANDEDPYKTTNDFIVGSALEIPTFLVKKKDTAGWSNADYVRLRLDSKPMKNVNYELWMTSSQQETYQFLERFKSFQKLFGNTVKIVPKYVLWYDFPSKVGGYSKEHPNCVSGGRFCAPDPDSDGKITGRDVVMEDLNQWCIWKEYSETDLMKWWNYMLAFGECFKDKPLKFKSCYETAADKADVSTSKVKKCINQSFGKESGDADFGIDPNEYLEQMREEFSKKKIGAWPLVAIHDNLYTNPLEDPESLFDAICQEFDEAPKICKNYWQPTTGATTGDYFWGIVLIVLILGGAFGLMIFLYKRMVKKELNQHMESQISSIVSQYYSMENKSGRDD